MKIKFQADNDLDEDILRAVKRLQPAIDFQRAPELDLHIGIPDPEILRLCAKENRLLVTHDRHSMPEHFIAFIQQHDSPGGVHRFAQACHQQSGGMVAALLGRQRRRRTPKPNHRHSLT